MELDNPKRPTLLNSTVTILSSKELKLKLNFANELYVSSMFDPDFITINIEEPFRFRSKSENKFLERNYTLATILP